MSKQMMEEPQMKDYDMQSKSGVEQFNARMHEFRKNFVANVYKMAKKPSYFSQVMFGLTLFAYNAKYVDDMKSRWIVYRAGRKVGKSTSTAVKILHIAWFANIIYKNTVTDVCNVLIVAPTQNQASIMMSVIKDMAKKNAIYAEFVMRDTATEITIKWLTGNGYTKIFIRAAGEKGVSLRGYMPHLIVVDEAAFVNHAVLIALLPSGMSQKARIILTSTPFGRVGYFAEKSENANSPKPRWKEYHVSSLQNPLVKDDPDLVEELKQVTTDQYKQEVLGEFLDEGDALIPKYMLKDSIVSRLNVPDNARYDLGVDIARAGGDETVFSLIAVDHDKGTVYVVKTFSESKSNIVQIVDRIEGYCRDFPIATVYMDETGLGAGAVDLALSKDLPAVGIVFSTKSRDEMYTSLRMLFENKKIKMQYIDKMFYQLSYLKREYVGGHMRVKTEDGMHDDYPDALALSCKAIALGDRWAVLSPAPHILG